MLTKLIRLLIATVASTLALLFTAMYVYVEKHNAIDHGNMDVGNYTMLVTRLANWMPLVPLGLLVVGLWALRSGRERLLDIVRDVMWAIAIVWPTMSLAMWKQPYALL